LTSELWNRVGLIAKLATEFKKAPQKLGKTAIMKIIFILQEVQNVPCGYKFSLYTYGPYCSDVLADLDYAEAIKGVEIFAQCAGTNGYNIEPAQKADEYMARANEFLRIYEKKINSTIGSFCKMSARDLELRSTIIYIYKNYLANKWDIELEQISTDLRELKPHFTSKDVEIAFEQLDGMGIFRQLCG